MQAFDDTLTDHEFTRALRESPLATLEHADRAEPDLDIDGLGHSLVSRLVALFLPQGRR